MFEKSPPIKHSCEYLFRLQGYLEGITHGVDHDGSIPKVKVVYAEMLLDMALREMERE